MALRRRKHGLRLATIVGVELLTLVGIVLAAQPHQHTAVRPAAEQTGLKEFQQLTPNSELVPMTDLILPPDLISSEWKMDRAATKPVYPTKIANAKPSFMSNYSY